jgi:phage terminase large subunit
MFLDSAGISGAIAPRLWDVGHKNVVEINFGADSPDAKYRNMRAFMWGRLKDWLLTGAIDNIPRLETDLTGPSFELDLKTRILLESKAEMKMNGFASPDDGDALALTFARKVVARVKESKPLPPPHIGIWG